MTGTERGLVIQQLWNFPGEFYACSHFPGVLFYRLFCLAGLYYLFKSSSSSSFVIIIIIGTVFLESPSWNENLQRPLTPSRLCLTLGRSTTQDQRERTGLMEELLFLCKKIWIWTIRPRVNPFQLHSSVDSLEIAWIPWPIMSFCLCNEMKGNNSRWNTFQLIMPLSQSFGSW